ncbi:MAG: HAD family phosphatase [Bacteroidota bacterium]|nr:HAD family phosphatase [Bacteroidota bacterium]
MEKEASEKRILKIIDEFETKAVIFDLDGTLIDNNSFHRKTWEAYLEKMGKKISEEEFNAHMNGRTNKDAIEYIFGRKMSEAESMKYTLEKEALYREIYQPYIKPIPGLIALLEILHSKNIPMAIATSGIQPNIDFMFEHIPIKKYFKEVVNSSHIKKGKPDPEIYLKTASLLHVSPKNCLVFEDAVVGIKAAKAAGMNVIAVATTHPKNELKEADMIVSDYEAFRYMK